MHNCSLSNANFVGADLREATPAGNAKLGRAILDKATLANADIGGADFLEANVTDLASFENTRGSFKAKN